MKKVCTLLLVQFFVYACFSQQIFFSTAVPLSAVSVNKQLPAGLLQNYSTTTYFKEAVFSPSDHFFLKLDAVKSVEVVQQKWYSYSNGAVSFTGKIKDEPNSSVVLSKYQNRWHGMITDAQLHKYMLQQTADDMYAVSAVEELSYIQQDKKEDFIETTPILAPTANYDVCAATNPCTSAGVVISIMVVYTPAAATAWGGVATTVANIATAVSNMNVANTNSGVNSNISFNLVHTEQVTYTESGTTGTDLSRLAATADGFMDNVHTLRTTHSADLVSLIVASPTNTCGIGYLNTNSVNYTASAGFNVVVYNCVVGNFSMAHELGHNMGLQHDWYVSSSTLPCSHHHGYVNQAVIPSGAPAAARWRTILAYNDQCAAQVPAFNCTRLNYWSNPTINNTGNPMGIAIGSANAAYEVYGINRFACVVSAFLGGNVLPLSLTNVAVQYNDGTLTVNWNTGNEINVNYFEIETAAKNTQQFTARRWVPAKNTSSAYYSETLTMHAQEDFYVRLKYADKDGRVKYSDVFYVRVAPDRVPKLQTSMVTGNAMVTLYNPGTVNYKIQVLGADGKQLFASSFTPLPGYSVNTVATGSLPAGAYFIKLLAGNEVHVLKFYKTAF